MKLHIGCGPKYLNGWINIDINRAIKADIYMDVSKEKLPFADNSIDSIYMCHSMEHIKDFWHFANELMRVCEPNAIIHSIVPHASTVVAFYPQHYTYWSVGSFETMRTDGINCANEDYCNLRVKVDSIKLHFLSHHCGPTAKWMWKLFKWWEWMWNRSDYVMQFAERLPFGWTEIEYKLIIDK